MADAPDRTLGVVNLSGEALSSLDTYYHSDEGQNLTTTDVFASPFVRVCEREVGEAKILGL